MFQILRAIYAEVRGLHQSAFLLAFFAFTSQVLALLRDRVFAHQFGAGTELDLYYAAFRVPDLLFVLFASVLSVYVLIPFVSERIEKEDTEGARMLLSQTLTVFCYTYIVVAALCALWAPAAVALLFPGFSGEAQETVVLLMRVLLIQPFLLGISGLFSVITQLGQRYVLYALSPLLYNGGIIFGAVVLYPIYGLVGLVYGVVAGACLHLAIQVPLVLQSNYAPRLLPRFSVRPIAAILISSVPRALTLSLNQIVLLAFAGIASAMAAGSVSVFQFAFNLQSVPLSIIGVSYSVAAFPLLAHLYARGNHSEFAMRVEAALRHMVFWLLPVTGLFIVLRAHVVRILLGSGAFGWEDTRLTSAALALFAFSLIAQSINLLLVRAFYAGGDTRTPFRVTLVGSGITLIVSLGLYALFVGETAAAHIIERILRIEGIPGSEVIALPLGYSIGQLIQMTSLLRKFHRVFSASWKALRQTSAQACIAALGGSLITYIALNVVVVGINKETFMGIFLQGAVSGFCGAIAAAWLLYHMGSAELAELWGALRRRRIMVRMFGPDNMDTLAH